MTQSLHWVDIAILASYFLLLFLLGFQKRRVMSAQADSSTELLLGGRQLTLPAFVASLVSTWYGGITGISEYTWSHGIETFFVFGLPYYCAAFLFAMLLAEPIRKSGALSLPDHLSKQYSPLVGRAAASVIFLMVLPGAYILILATLAEYLFGWSFWFTAPLLSLVSVAYLAIGGFRSVVRTDIFQTILMYLGFIVLFLFLVFKFGGFEFLQQSLSTEFLKPPSTSTAWLGIASWFIVALATLVDPAFFQRCLATQGSKIPSRGILISILCWVLFDFLSISCALYAKALLSPEVSGTLAYPALALQFLPIGVAGIFLLAVVATAQSSVDSYLFIAATTFANDWKQPVSQGNLRNRLIIGLLIAVLCSLAVAAIFSSVVQIWYLFGSLAAGMLLVPVIASFYGPRMPASWAFLTMSVGGVVVLYWEIAQRLDPAGASPFGLPTAIPALLATSLSYAVGRSVLKLDTNHTPEQHKQ